MKIDKYENSIYIRFEKGAEVYRNLSNHPEYNRWRNLLKFLKRRGFQIETPIYYKEQSWGISNHKTGIKQDNATFCLEFMENQIKIEFGHFKNLWKDWGCNFWTLTDNRSTQLTYLEQKKVDNEVQKLLKYLGEYNNHFKKLSPEEKIIKDKKESCHSYKKEKLDELGLGGVEYQMSEYDKTQNSQDKNKKQILCGEEKYYYDRKILKKGRVYHQLNNRWFVLSGGELKYVSSWELFDFDKHPRRKQLNKEEKINRLETELRKQEQLKNYLRCISINKHIDKLKSEENIYNVWSIKHNEWWRANNSGYTSNKSEAGVYLESNIKNNQDYYNDGITTKAILIK